MRSRQLMHARSHPTTRLIFHGCGYDLQRTPETGRNRDGRVLQRSGIRAILLLQNTGTSAELWKKWDHPGPTTLRKVWPFYQLLQTLSEGRTCFQRITASLPIRNLRPSVRLAETSTALLNLVAVAQNRLVAHASSMTQAITMPLPSHTPLIIGLSSPKLPKFESMRIQRRFCLTSL